MSETRIQAVVFDLDGVLIDTEEVWEEVRRGYVAEAGREFLPDSQQRMMGMSTGEWSRHLSVDVGVGRTPEIVARDVLGRMAARYRDALPLIPGGVVLTGGGSLLEGMTELAEDVLGMRARTITPLRVRGEVKPVQKPQYATSVGLLYFSARNGDPRPKGKGAGASSFGSIVEAVKGWFRGR